VARKIRCPRPGRVRSVVSVCPVRGGTRKETIAMDPVDEGDIRSSFINCSKGDAKRLFVPRDLADRPWPDLDFLGWGDPALPGRCYLAVPGQQRLIGVALRCETGLSGKTQMCAICMTTHTGGGVWLMTGTRRASPAGGATRSALTCARTWRVRCMPGILMRALIGRHAQPLDLQVCPNSDRISNSRHSKKRPALGSRYREDLSLEQKVDRVRGNMDAFIARLYR
jgi:hypothetical protein